jgi:hypothetical protein
MVGFMALCPLDIAISAVVGRLEAAEIERIQAWQSDEASGVAQ